MNVRGLRPVFSSLILCEQGCTDGIIGFSSTLLAKRRLVQRATPFVVLSRGRNTLVRQLMREWVNFTLKACKMANPRRGFAHLFFAEQKYKTAVLARHCCFVGLVSDLFLLLHKIKPYSRRESIVGLRLSYCQNNTNSAKNHTKQCIFSQKPLTIKALCIIMYMSKYKGELCPSR